MAGSEGIKELKDSVDAMLLRMEQGFKDLQAQQTAMQSRMQTLLDALGQEERHLSETSPEEKSEIHDMLIFLRTNPFDNLTTARNFCMVKQVLECEDTAYLAPYYNMMTEAESYIEKDDKVEFKYFLEYNELVHNFPPRGLFYLICNGNAPGCAAAFLEAGFHVDLNEPLSNAGYYPLEYAARHLSYDLAHILLQHGANPYVPIKDYDWVYNHDQLILGVALDELCNNEYVKQWNTEKSIFKLFYLLCLPALKGPLDTIHLLAYSTEKDNVIRMLFHHVFKYEFVRSEPLVKLIAFLMAEKDNLLVPSAEAGETLDSPSFWQLFSYHFGSNPLKRLYNELETLWRAIDVLDHYRHSPSVKSVPKRKVPFDIARALMNEAKLELKPEDVYCNDIDCLRPINKSNAEDLARQLMQESVGSSLHSSHWSRNLQ